MKEKGLIPMRKAKIIVKINELNDKLKQTDIAILINNTKNKINIEVHFLEPWNCNLTNFGILDEKINKFFLVEESRNTYCLSIINEDKELTCKKLRMSKKIIYQFLKELIDLI